MNNFFTDVIEKSPEFTVNADIKDMNLLEPGTRTAVLALIAEATTLGHDLRVVETYRSSQRQMYLYEQGLTELRHVGVHRFGLACDIALFIDGKYEDRGSPFYEFYAQLAPKHGLISGIDWGTPKQKHSFKDYDHVQRIPVFRQAGLFNGTWYPPEEYDPWADQKENHVG